MSDIRYDRLHDTYVLIAPERLHRPDTQKYDRAQKNHTVCPFCEGNESMTPKEIFALRPNETLANQAGWKTRVVPNLYKAVAIEAPHKFHESRYWDGFGAHEVIIDTPEHKTSMVQWSNEERIDWLKTLRQRVGDLRRDSRLKHISLFKNEGGDAGSTMAHSHTQLIALPLIPKDIHLSHTHASEYFHHHNHALLESILEEEEQCGERIIASMGEFSAYCPYASSFAFEVIISSKKYIGHIDTISDADLEDLAALLGDVVDRLADQLDELTFNLAISTPPLSDEGGVCEAHRLSLRILPRLYRLGGFEISSGMMINPLSPEYAAKLLRGEDHV